MNNTNKVTLSIRNFGPLKSVTLNVQDFIVFIGPQASGKSTIVKAILFFKTLKDDLTHFIFDTIDQNSEIDFFETGKPTTQFKKIIRSKFVGYWGTTKHLDEFEIKYNYNDKEVTLRLDKEGYVKAYFNNALHDSLDQIFNHASFFQEKYSKKSQSYFSTDELLTFESQKRTLLIKIGSEAEEIFGDSRMPIFIPAGRSLLSTLSDQLQKYLLTSNRKSQLEMDEMDPYLLDFPLKGFIDRISRTKTLFTQSMQDIIEDKKKFTSTPIDFINVYFIKELINTILKGRYIYDKDSEKLYLPNSNKYVRLTFASSGQQEAIWILLQSFLITLNKYKVTLIIEEPEAHLYPESQKEIVELIAAISNMQNNQIFITTHSPYILASCNNLLYAAKIGAKRRSDINKIIDSRLWIPSRKFAAYLVKDGYIKDIVDDDVGLIKVEEIDNVASIINDTYEKIAEFDK